MKHLWTCVAVGIASASGGSIRSDFGAVTFTKAQLNGSTGQLPTWRDAFTLTWKPA